MQWEIETALAKGCRIIGINLDGACQLVDETCPLIIRNVGAVFVPFSQKIIAHALADWKAQPNNAWYYDEAVYQTLGYKVRDGKLVKEKTLPPPIPTSI